MLEGLNEIDWSQVPSDHGMSEAVPGAIRDLVSEDAKKRQDALQVLWFLENQGTVTLASVYAVPFLLEVLTHPKTQDKLQLADLVTRLACKGAYMGNSYVPLETRLLWQEASSWTAHPLFKN